MPVLPWRIEPILLARASLGVRADDRTLVGHSMGAVTAALVAAEYPDSVQALILEDPPLLDRSPSQAEISGALLSSQGDLLAGAHEEPGSPSTWAWLFELRALPPAERLARAYALQLAWAEVQIAVLDAAHAAVVSFPWSEVFARIQCPTLLIAGDPQLGAILTPETTRQAAALARQCQIVQIAGAGHNIRRDRYEAMWRAVTAFLNKIEDKEM